MSGVAGMRAPGRTAIPDKVLLSEAVPNHPVFLGSLHGFAGWANQMALDRAGIDSDDRGARWAAKFALAMTVSPTACSSTAQSPWSGTPFPPSSHEALKERVLIGLNQMAEDGYVAVHDAGLDTAMMAALEALEAEDRLPIRVYAMVSLTG